MLLAAITVLVVVASSPSGEAAEGSTQAMEQAFRGALGRDVELEIRRVPAGATDESLVADALVEHAALLVVVAWSEGPRRAALRIVKPTEGRWTDREIRFDNADAATERGRTVGFALASMVPDDALSAPPPAPPPPERAPPPPEASSHRESPAPAYLPPPNPLALEAAALAVTAPGGYGGGIGGVFALRVPLTGALAARVGMSLRAGEVAPAQATSRVIVGGAGLAWQPWLDAPHRWAVGARIDALVVHHDLGHLSADDPDVAHLSRFLPGLDLAVEGAFRFSDRAAFVVAAGTEIALGTTEVRVHDRLVASLPPARLLGELGLRVSF
jgi:hypothetical protein